jgi:UTP-glucose-1-phosphate uridylyltransferase
MVPSQYQSNGRQKPWGTGHAMLCARDVISEPFVAINADDFYGHESFSAMAEFFAANIEGHHAMIGYTLENVLSDHGSVSRGCGESDNDGFLTSVVERTTIVKEGGKIISRETSGDQEMSPDTPTSMNFWGFQPNIFELTSALFTEFLEKKKDKPKAEFYIPIIVNEMVRTGSGKVKILKGSDYWFGVTYQDDKSAVSKKIRQLVDAGEYPRDLWR